MVNFKSVAGKNVSDCPGVKFIGKKVTNEFTSVVSGNFIKLSNFIAVIVRVKLKLNKPLLSGLKMLSPIKFLIFNWLFTTGKITFTSQLA